MLDIFRTTYYYNKYFFNEFVDYINNSFKLAIESEYKVKTKKEPLIDNRVRAILYNRFHAILDFLYKNKHITNKEYLFLGNKIRSFIMYKKYINKKGK